MWLLADYRPTGLFSLRSSVTTSSGGRTNLVPTMYAVKMALIGAAFETGGDGEQIFSLVARRQVRMRPPEWAAVSNTFVKIQREPHDRGARAAFQPTVGYREFAWFGGDLTVAVDLEDLESAEAAVLGSLFPSINYFGKRGSFFQFIRTEQAADLTPGFSMVVGDRREVLADSFIIQYLDDFGPVVTFEAINTYGEAPVRIGRERIFVPVALPYRKTRSSRGYTLYRRTAE